jgi:hypothetical protein
MDVCKLSHESTGTPTVVTIATGVDAIDPVDVGDGLECMADK